MSNFRIFRRIVLSLIVLAATSTASHAQTALAIFDTLDMRLDLSKPAIKRYMPLPNSSAARSDHL